MEGQAGEAAGTGAGGNEQTDIAARTWNRLDGDALLEEANALALYVGRHGDGLSDDDADGGSNDPYQALLEAIAAASSSPSTSSWETLMQAYAKVAKVTSKKRGVNGRSVLDTANDRQSRARDISWLRHSWKGLPRYRPLLIGLSFFAAALAVQAVPHLADQNPDGFLVRLTRALNPLLVPALWGGIGACTFLAKHISNKLSQQAYERARQQGDVVRVFLGAMIGVFAVVAFTDFEMTSIPLATGPVATGATAADSTATAPVAMDAVAANPIAMGPIVIAFVAGLAVKPVYAGIEALANALASRLRA
ncbi:hypothetical protein [Candidatus Palauibacter sp.]|uniref:hypothetical protein n=1 Tax=Candidatus Palauibacter sp. TaxID=3101350 RepID=UPI003B01B8F6